MTEIRYVEISQHLSPRDVVDIHNYEEEKEYVTWSLVPMRASWSCVVWKVNPDGSLEKFDTYYDTSG